MNLKEDNFPSKNARSWFNCLKFLMSEFWHHNKCSYLVSIFYIAFLWDKFEIWACRCTNWRILYMSTVFVLGKELVTQFCVQTFENNASIKHVQKCQVLRNTTPFSTYDYLTNRAYIWPLYVVLRIDRYVLCTKEYQKIAHFTMPCVQCCCYHTLLSINSLNHIQRSVYYYY